MGIWKIVEDDTTRHHQNTRGNEEGVFEKKPNTISIINYKLNIHFFLFLLSYMLPSYY
jgi:hypothetical protein